MSDRAMWSTLCVFALLCSSPSVGGVILDGVNDSEYLSLAAEPAYAGVGSVSWTEGSSSYIGSGTYLGDGWVLTAAHVADGADFAGGGQSTWTFAVGGSTYFADEFVIHPEWTSSQGDLNAGVDLALVKLSTDPIDFSGALLYEETDEKDYTATLVGYGSTGVGESGYEEFSAGTKRAGQNEIDAFGRDRRVRAYDDAIMFVDFDSPTASTNLWGSSAPLELEYLTAPGDSGGGLFIDVDGVTYLAGVTSFGLAFDGDVDADYGDAGGYIRVSQHIDWIDEVTGLLTEPAVSPEGDIDGALTAADYAVWRDLLGQTVEPGTSADFDGNGLIDLDDYDLWASGLEGSSPINIASIPVPEPTTSPLLAVGLAATIGTVARRNRHSRTAGRRFSR